MAFPVVEATAESATTSAGTNHVVVLPAGIVAGHLILILMDIGSTAATLNAHADYTELLDENLANGLKILYRRAAGGESNPTFVSSASTRSAEITYLISGAENPATQAPEIGTTATGTSATPDPPSVTPTGGAKDYLWIAFFGQAGEEADDDTWVNTPPTDFIPSPPLQKACGVAGTNLGGKIGAASRQVNAASQDPGTFAVDVSAAWRTQTVAVHPAAAVEHTVNQTDSVGLTDAAALTFDWTREDQTGLTDSATVGLQKTVDATDSVGLTDAVAQTFSWERADSTGLTDQATAATTHERSVTDQTGLTDATATQVLKAVDQTDSVGLSDATGLQLEQLYTDPVGLTDQATTAATHARTVTDSAGLTDALASQLVKAVDAIDSVGLTDTTLTDGDYLRLAEDLIGLTDSVSIQLDIPDEGWSRDLHLTLGPPHLAWAASSPGVAWEPGPAALLWRVDEPTAK